MNYKNKTTDLSNLYNTLQNKVKTTSYNNAENGTTDIYLLYVPNTPLIDNELKNSIDAQIELLNGSIESIFK